MSEGPTASWYVTSPSLLRTFAPGAAALAELRTRLLTPSSTTAAALSEELEELVERDPAAIAFDDAGHATLHTPRGPIAAGRFTTPSIAELRATLPRQGAHRARLSVLEGADALTDIGAMQGSAPDGVLFQAASQFNCLEAPGPSLVPVREYVFDPTQGPRASVSALGGTLVRHHAATGPDGNRFVQTDERCVNLLADVVRPEVATVQGGYLSSDRVHDMSALARALEDGFESVRVGLHEGVEVVFGANWNGRVARPGARIAQVFTSTMALGGYGRDDGSADLVAARRQLQRGAYLGTLLGAAAVGAHTAVLTLIGGGVFGNPASAIWDGNGFALDEVDAHLAAPLHVVVAARTPLTSDQRALVRQRGGFIATFAGGGVQNVDDAT